MIVFFPNVWKLKQYPIVENAVSLKYYRIVRTHLYYLSMVFMICISL